MSTGTQGPGTASRNPLVLRFILKQAGRRTNLTSEERANLDTIISSRQGLQIVGEAIDEASSGQSATTAKLGDGTLLKLLVQNLPQLIAIVMEIMKAFPAASSAPTARVNESAMPTDFALPPIPPALLAALQHALVAAVQSALDQIGPIIRGEFQDWLKGHQAA